MLLNRPRGCRSNIFPQGLARRKEIKTEVPKKSLLFSCLTIESADSLRRGTIWIRLDGILYHADMKRDWRTIDRHKYHLPLHIDVNFARKQIAWVSLCRATHMFFSFEV